jgi:hypothetical protein
MRRKTIKGYKVRLLSTKYELNKPVSELHKLIDEERAFEAKLEKFIDACKKDARRITEENRPRRYYDLSLRLHQFLKQESIDLLTETNAEQRKYKQKKELLSRFGTDVLRLEETEQLTNIRAIFLFPILERDPEEIDWTITWHRRFELLRLHGDTLAPEDPVYALERKRLEGLVSKGAIPSRDELRRIVTERNIQLRGGRSSYSVDGQEADSGHL